MPIFLPSPGIRTGGPDGQGWNRLSLYAAAVSGDECALRPRTPGKFFESQDTRRAAYGGFGGCGRGGQCADCPVFNAAPETIDRPGEDRILIRIDDQGRPHECINPETGWDGFTYWWTWDRLARVQGWAFDGLHRDEHSEGFWLRRATVERHTHDQAQEVAA